jgi:hypothetical protein
MCKKRLEKTELEKSISDADTSVKFVEKKKTSTSSEWWQYYHHIIVNGHQLVILIVVYFCSLFNI